MSEKTWTIISQKCLRYACFDRADNEYGYLQEPLNIQTFKFPEEYLRAYATLRYDNDIDFCNIICLENGMEIDAPQPNDYPLVFKVALEEKAAAEAEKKRLRQKELDEAMKAKQLAEQREDFRKYNELKLKLGL